MSEALPGPGVATSAEPSADPHDAGRPGWVARFLAARGLVRRSRGGHVTWKVVVTVVGVVVICAGIAMLALPGPGWATIVLGLAILSTEFEWAARWRHAVVRWLTAAAHRVQAFPRWLRLVTWALVGLGLLALGYGTLVVLGVPDWAPEGPREALRSWPLVRG